MELRPSPSRRASVLAADEEAAEQLEHLADELTVQSREQQDARAREEALARMRGRDKPVVPIAEWISNPYYTGAIDLWPATKDQFVELLDRKPSPTVILFRGGTNTAKSFTCALVVLRSIYELGSMMNPHSRVGNFSPIAPLKIALMHLSQRRARSKLLETLVGMVRTAGWFREHFPPQKTVYSGVNVSRLEFPGLVVEPVSTDPKAIVSDDVVGLHASEVNEYAIVEGSTRLRGDQGSYDVGWRVYREALNRLRSRFSPPYDSAVKFLFDSAERYDGDCTSRIDAELPDTGVPHAVAQRSNWEMRPGRNRGPWFDFAIPTKGKRGEVVETKERKAELEVAGRRLVRVPRGPEDETLHAAETDPDDFSINQGGWPTDAIGRWVDDPGVFDLCVAERAAYLQGIGVDEDPVAAFPEQWKLGHVLTDDRDPDWTKVCTQDVRGVWRPRVLPYSLRFAHFDLATTGEDYVGFAMGTLLDVREGCPVVWYDASVRFLRDGPEYDFELLREVVRALRRHGFPLSFLTFDSYQDYDFSKIMKAEGLKTWRVSMVRSIDGWKAFRPGLTSGRALLPIGEDTVGREELSQLERRVENGKVYVKHRPGGHDDLAQAQAAVYWQVSEHVPLLRSAPTQITRPVPPHELEARLQAMLSPHDRRSEEVSAEALDKVQRDLAKARRQVDRERGKELQKQIDDLKRRGVRP